MQIYTVGGAVRDEMLGLPVADRDYVVVGASPEAMIAEGYKPVGKDFPVFLHPKSHEEYALARTERKTAPGYHGFAFHAEPDVTLEEDLARRDLTINAMARGEDGVLVDPYGGAQDIAARVLRHVGPAFVEDPVRILRLARFAARYTDFTVAPETMALMQQMVRDGEVDHLVPERVWQELAKGLMEKKPSRMFVVLRDCGALKRLLPELDALFGVPQRAEFHPEVDTGIHTLMVVDQSAYFSYALPVRWAALLHDLGKGLTPPEILPRHHGHETASVSLASEVCVRLKVPNDCRDLALLTARYHGEIHRAAELRPSTLVSLLEKTDSLRRPERFRQLLEACRCDYTGRLGSEAADYPQFGLLEQALAAVQGLNAGALVQSIDDKSQIPLRLHEARVGAVKMALKIARID